MDRQAGLGFGSEKLFCASREQRLPDPFGLVANTTTDAFKDAYNAEASPAMWQSKFMTAIEANAPLRELFGYSSAMRSLSQGRAGCSMEPLKYEPAPPDVMKQYELA